MEGTFCVTPSGKREREGKGKVGFFPWTDSRGFCGRKRESERGKRGKERSHITVYGTAAAAATTTAQYERQTSVKVRDSTNNNNTILFLAATDYPKSVQFLTILFNFS